MQLSSDTSGEAHAIAKKSIEIASEAKRIANDTASAFGEVAEAMKSHVDGNFKELKRVEALVVSTKAEVLLIPANVKSELAPSEKEERNTKLRRWGIAVGIIAYGVFQAFQLLKGGH